MSTVPRVQAQKILQDLILGHALQGWRSQGDRLPPSGPHKCQLGTGGGLGDPDPILLN